jgi:hypothetical protein
MTQKKAIYINAPNIRHGGGLNAFRDNLRIDKFS